MDTKKPDCLYLGDLTGFRIWFLKTGNDFRLKGIKEYVCPTDSVIDRQYYEICLALQLHQTLKSGEIWAAGGRRYGNIDALLIANDLWSGIRDEHYEELRLPKDPKVWLNQVFDNTAITS
ncbi:MAG: hypothetical protein R3E01_12870 [Pirellulaceae bacterium]|nr:hypothetical protein [Planctomycetales bacterium]